MLLIRSRMLSVLMGFLKVITSGIFSSARVNTSLVPSENVTSMSFTRLCRCQKSWEYQFPFQTRSADTSWELPSVIVTVVPTPLLSFSPSTQTVDCFASMICLGA